MGTRLVPVRFNQELAKGLTVVEDEQKAKWKEQFGIDIDDVENRKNHIISTQHIEDMGPKQAAIARALIHRGVVIWAGIPQHIIEELHNAGYKISKRRNSGGRQRPQ